MSAITDLTLMQVIRITGMWASKRVTAEDAMNTIHEALIAMKEQMIL